MMFYSISSWIKKHQKVITIIIALCMLLIASSQTFLVVHYQNELHEANQILRSIQFEPRLKLVNLPIISPIEVKMKLNPPIPYVVGEESKIRIIPTSHGKIDTVKMKVEIDDIIIHCQLKFTNLEKSKAKILGVAYTDTLSYLPKIREKLFQRDTTKCKVDNFKEPIELLSGESYSFKVNHSIQFLDNNRFTLHFIVLYSNEIGNVYDTYVWVPYQYHQIDTVGAFELIPGQKPKMKMLRKSNEIVSIERDPVSTYYPYTIEEANKLDQFFDLVRLQKFN